MKHPVLGGTLVAFGICFVSCGFIGMMGDSNSSSSHKTSTVKTETVSKDYITLDDYEKIEVGMKYSDAVNLVGYEAEKLSESQFDDIITTMYYWYGEDGISNVTIIVQNGVVLSKSQVGLE